MPSFRADSLLRFPVLMMEATKTNQFHGLSTLRAQERVKQPKSEQAKALEAYLKKYTGGGDSGAYFR